ncbi:MAG: hypothetical protein JWP63_2660 [Candidatus Solibacter sp.]|nr:hypothetical protein [Candidatus Solibacter sp.]
MRSEDICVPQNTVPSLVIAKSWWSLWIRGMAAILLGAITVLWKAVTITDLVLLFFGYAFVDGLVGIAGAFRAAQQRERGGILLLVEGVLGVAAALLAATWTGLTDLGEMYLIAAWALATGAVEIAAALNLRRYLTGELLLACSGVASLVLGAIMAVLPLTGPSMLARSIGAYAFVFGVLLIGLGFRLRSRVRLPAIAV